MPTLSPRDNAHTHTLSLSHTHTHNSVCAGVRWERAEIDNPDPEKLEPVRELGIAGLKARLSPRFPSTPSAPLLPPVSASAAQPLHAAPHLT